MKKKKNSNIFNHLLCHVVSISLKRKEVKKILDKAKFDYSDLDQIGIHQLIKDELSDDTVLSKRIFRYLNNKYASELKKFKDYSIKEWVDFLNKNLSIDNLASSIWISATLKDLTKEESLKIFNIINIFIPYYLEDSIAKERELELNQKNIIALEKKYLQLTTQRQEEINKFKTIIKENDLIIDSLKKQSIINVNKVNKEKSPVNLAYESKWEKKYNISKEKNKELIKEKSKLKRDIKEYKKLIKDYEQDILLLNTELNEIRNCDKCKFDSSNIPAECPKKILLVGGLEGLKSSYAQLANQMSLNLDYHNGCCKNGIESLSNKIGRCDAVICPIDINSHSACLAVKRFCKKMNKSFYMVNRSSISSLEETLKEICS